MGSAQHMNRYTEFENYPFMITATSLRDQWVNAINHFYHVPAISLSPNNSLRWRHNGRESVSNHQHHDCLLNRLFRLRSKKTSKLCVTGLCAGNSPGTGEFPAQTASYAENVSIWWRHHAVQASRYWPELLLVCTCLCNLTGPSTLKTMADAAGVCGRFFTCTHETMSWYPDIYRCNLFQQEQVIFREYRWKTMPIMRFVHFLHCKQSQEKHARWIANFESHGRVHEGTCHWGAWFNSSPLTKVAAISQTTFSNAFSWVKSFVFWLIFHWSLFLRVKLTIFQHRLR